MQIHDFEAVIFDLDGTLVDSMWMWKSIDIEYLQRFGIELPDNLQSEIEGMSFTETAVYFKNRFNIPYSIDEIKSQWNEMSKDMYMHRIKTKTGAVEFLEFLKGINIIFFCGQQSFERLLILLKQLILQLMKLR